MAGVWALHGHRLSQVLGRWPRRESHRRNSGASVQSSKLLVVRANQLTSDHQDHAEVDLLIGPCEAEKRK